MHKGLGAALRGELSRRGMDVEDARAADESAARPKWHPLGWSPPVGGGGSTAPADNTTAQPMLPSLADLEFMCEAAGDHSSTCSCSQCSCIYARDSVRLIEVATASRDAFRWRERRPDGAKQVLSEEEFGYKCIGESSGTNAAVIVLTASPPRSG